MSNSSSRDHAQTSGSAVVDLSKIEVGDEVTVRGKVLSVNRAGTTWVAVDFSGDVYLGGGRLSVRPGQIAAHTPKAFAVGDRVMSRSIPAEVIAIRGTDVCIAFDAEPDALHVRPARMLERAQ